MILFSVAIAADVHPTATELVALTHVGSPTLSPDGSTLLFGMGGSSYDPDAKVDGGSENGWTDASQLYILPVDGGEPRAITTGDEGPRDAHWSPDGSTILFVRDGAIHLLPRSGGEPRRVPLDLDPHHVRFSPDGRALRFLATPEPDETESAARFRRGDVHRFEVADPSRLYTVDLEGGEPTALTDGSVHVMDFSEAADGSLALVVSDGNNAYERAIHARLQVQRDGNTVDIEGRCVDAVRWSPRGDALAWVGCRTGGLTDAVYVWDGEQTRNVLEHADPTVSDVTWTPDGRELLATVTDRTDSSIWRIPARGGSHRLVARGGSIRGLTVGPRGRTAYARRSTPTHPNRLVAIDLKSGKARDLYDPNPHTDGWGAIEPQLVNWKSPEAEIEGILYPPSGDGPHPLLVMPHGGPDGVSTRGYDAWGQFFAARGYAVLRPNYRGGIGYGRDFYAANRGRLGAIELMDIESGVDALIERGIADPERLYYGGWSWGGYLTAWTIGHTNRYRAAVAGAAVTDTQAQYVGSDINHGTVGDWEFTGRPWKDWEKYDAANPRRHFTAIETPTLILHGDADARVPFDQGVTLYRALSDQGVEVEFWQYPGEGHGLRRPAHQVHRLEVWHDWLRRH